MAGLRALVSVLLVCISFQNINAACTLGPRSKKDKSVKFSPECGSAIAIVSVRPEIQKCTNFPKLFPIHASQTGVSAPIQVCTKNS
ncbi:hypothetical protein PGTUg99_033574 [Puccinia graminis f. sp. tritici]|uniref:Uncharacterized protein n=1 Tax=Puccinia graminis f. sp. tritici TaxID=56615 RepID=A0A5B0R9Y8_PUCGR|nr:hypothetical protein PGTUg99_033574 [Puccinia graminis f. sp. tritici]